MTNNLVIEKRQIIHQTGIKLVYVGAVALAAASF